MTSVSEQLLCLKNDCFMELAVCVMAAHLVGRYRCDVPEYQLQV
jgi:hypothetical protein